ncbi:MAG TPA: DMT family transporter [Allosphingosinicella sp.]|jgi:drug/metabolite transporter (DMT)-like permease
MTGSSATANVARRALLLALGGFFALSVGDAVVKTMAGLWPGSAIALLRYSIGAVGLGVFVRWRYGRSAFELPRPWLQFGRGAAVGVATFGFFMGVMVMPLADATAIVFTGPVWTVLLSAIFLRERPSGTVMISILLASAGVLLILRPNVLVLGWEALFPLMAAVAMACLMILNRRAAGLAPAMVMQMLVAVMAVPVLLAMALASHFSDPALALSPPPWSVVARCALVAVTATMGHWMIFRATELASAATIAPMTYVQLLVATGAGIILFGDVPTWPMVLGSTLIISGGLWLWHKQRGSPPVEQVPAEPKEGR